MQINKKTSKMSGAKKTLIGFFIFILLASAAYVVLAYNQRPAPVPPAPSGVKLKPATKEEKKEADQKKEEIVKEQSQQEAPPPTPSGKKQVSVVITNASASSVNAYVSGIFEEGGTCSAIFTQGSMSITRTSQGFANVSYTQCAPITPNLSTGGSWSVVVSYNSASAEGKSEPQTFSL